MNNRSRGQSNIPRQAFCLILTFILLAAASQTVSAQEISSELLAFNEKRLDITKTGMLVLSGWALTNITVGGYGNFTTNGRIKYFHQMNAAWNIVNLGIGTFAYFQALQTDPSSFSLAQSLQESQSFEKILLLNIGLDVGYMATGAYLWERGMRKNSNRLLGYGPALMLQGGFLLVFDAILYAVHTSQSQVLHDLLNNVNITGNQLSISIPL